MRKTRWALGAGFLLVALACVVSWWWCNAGFTPWMSHAELDRFLAQYDTTPPGSHPNYWDQGHWINAVEGRWHEGIPQYRIRLGPVPKHRGLWWYWYFNQSQDAFSDHVHQLADQGFVLLDPNSFLRPDGTRRYQGVWHKVTPPRDEPASAPSSTPAPATAAQPQTTPTPTSPATATAQ